MGRCRDGLYATSPIECVGIRDKATLRTSVKDREKYENTAEAVFKAKGVKEPEFP